MKTKFLYNKALADRFASDYKLPMPFTKNEDYFRYYLTLLEKDYGARAKYWKLCAAINEKFNGSVDAFLTDYYDTREAVIRGLLNNPSFLEFNNCDMSKYAVKDRPKDVPDGNVFNDEYVGSRFLSVDLKKANFQALRYANPDIVLGCDTYADFIGKYTDSEYIKNSKYFREVIFGKANPKRHITVEKFLINEVRKVLDLFLSTVGLDEMYSLERMCNDELTYHIDDKFTQSNERSFLDAIKSLMHDKLGLEVSAEIFTLDGYVLTHGDDDKLCRRFYCKKTEDGNELKCVPLQFFPIVYKLLNGLKLSEIDYHFNYEGIDARLSEELKIYKTNK